MRFGTLAGILALALLGLAQRSGADVVELRSGEWLLGNVAEESDGRVVLEHALLGRLELPAEQVTAVRLGEPAPPPAPPAAEVAPLPAAAPAPEPVREGLLGTGFLRGWERQIELGLNGSRGNSETMDVRAGFEAGFADEDRRWSFTAGYGRAEDDKQLIDEAGFAELLRDWLFPGSPWFFFAQARYDFDEFKAWDHRGATSGGIGYQFLANERWNVRGRAGLGITRTFGSEDDEIVPEGVFGAEVLRVLGKGHEISAYTTFFPDFLEFGEFRNLAGMDWRIRLEKGAPLSLRLGFENVHESRVEGDAERNDLNYFGTLVLDF